MARSYARRSAVPSASYTSTGCTNIGRYSFPEPSRYGSPTTPSTVPAMPLTRKAVTFVFCQTARSSRRTTAIFVSNCTSVADDEVAVFRVPLDIAADERTDRDGMKPMCANVVERAGDQTASETLPLERRRDLGVHERNAIGRAPVEDLARNLAVDDELVAPCLRVVADHDRRT